ncbi:MAG: metallopeptidase TldD-related protein, partial [Thermoleophilia bacterium]
RGERRIELAMSVEAAALAADPRVKTVEDTMYADGDGEVFIASTAGVRGSYRSNQCYAFAYVLAEQDGQVETGYSYTVGRALEDLDPEGCGREAAERACRLLGATKCASMKVPVVLDPFVSAAFFGVLSSALTADAVQKGRSLFAGREGQRVAGDLLQLDDDGVCADGLDSAPFDGEGTPCRRTPLIGGGVLQGFLYDTYTARKAGRGSTGNGVRGGYAGLPSVRPTNLVVGGPATPLADIIGGLDFMATFASLADAKLPEKDREGQPIIFDSYDMTPVLFDSGKCPRDTWDYFTENELAPGAIRLHQYKFVFNLRGDGGQATGGLAVDSNLGWKGPDKYVAVAPQIFDLLADPQERYDILMNGFTEHTWMAPIMGKEIERVMKTFVQYPPRKMQSDTYSGPITITAWEKFAWLREQLKKDGLKLSLPSGN